MLNLWALFDEAQENHITTASEASAPPLLFVGMEVLTPAPAALGYTNPTITKADEPPAEGRATKPKQKGTTGKHTQRSTAQGTGSIHAPRTSTLSPPRTQRRSAKKDKEGAKKVAERFVAIIRSQR